MNTLLIMKNCCDILLPSESYNECLVNCQGDDRCQWFTFYPDAQVCELMISCPDGPTAECQNDEPCFSGEAQCKQLLQCDVNSLWCEDPHVGFWVHIDNIQECKDLCYEEQLCQWYNFDASTHTCLLTPSCDISTTTCTTCTAGQRECLDARPTEMNKLMIVGGYWSDQYAVEVIDLSGNNLTCPQLQNGPLNFGAVGTFYNDHAIVCAGVNDPSNCHAYDNETDSWAVVPGPLAYPNHYRGSVLLSDGRWWIAGGSGVESNSRNETEIVYPGNGTSETFTTLPRSSVLFTLLQWNKSAVIFLSDGFGIHDDVWLFNLDTEEWTEMPNMPTSRAGAAAGLATFPDGSRQLVVTGGLFSDITTHAFNFDTNTWRLVRGNLPYDLYVSSSVQFKNTFLLIGGRNTSSPYDEVNTILEFDPMNEAWIVREETMRKAKTFLAAFLVPDDYVKCV